MKVLLALALTLAVVTVSDARRQGRQRPGRQQKPKEDPGTIIRCMAENFGQDDRIQECRDCFKNLEGEFMSAGWITAAKQCAADYWPQLVQECSTEIAAMTAGDMESGGEVVECFDEALETRNYERCLNEADASGSDEEKLTDGAMCVMESWKFGMEYIKNATQPAKQFRPRPGGRRPRECGGRAARSRGSRDAKWRSRATGQQRSLHFSSRATQATSADTSRGLLASKGPTASKYSGKTLSLLRISSPLAQRLVWMT